MSKKYAGSRIRDLHRQQMPPSYCMMLICFVCFHCVTAHRVNTKLQYVNSAISTARSINSSWNAFLVFTSTVPNFFNGYVNRYVMATPHMPYLHMSTSWNVNSLIYQLLRISTKHVLQYMPQPTSYNSIVPQSGVVCFLSTVISAILMYTYVVSSSQYWRPLFFYLIKIQCIVGSRPQ